MKGDPHEASALFILPLNLQFDSPVGEFHAGDPCHAIVWGGIEEDGLCRARLRLIEFPVEHFDLIGLGKFSQVVVSGRCQCRQEHRAAKKMDVVFIRLRSLFVSQVFDSLLAQRRNRIDARRATGGQPAGQQRHAQQENGNARESERIGRFQVE